MQGCRQCDGSSSNFRQTSADGLGVNNTDTIIYYTFRNTGACSPFTSILAYANHCELESMLDRQSKKKGGGSSPP